MGQTRDGCCAASRASGAVRVLLHWRTRLSALLLVRTGPRPLGARRRSGHGTHALLAALRVAPVAHRAARSAASSLSQYATQSSIEPRVCRTRREGARRHSAQLGRNARYALLVKMNSFLLPAVFTLFYYSVYLYAGGLKCAYYSNTDFRFEARELRSRIDLPSFTEMQEKLKLPDKLIEYASETYLKETGNKFTFQEHSFFS